MSLTEKIGQAVLDSCEKIKNFCQSSLPVKEPVPLPANAVILADGVYSVPTQEKYFFEGNNLVVGCAGSGKNRAYIMPNLMQMNCNYVLTDVKGENLRKFYHVFRDNGYDVQVFSANQEVVIIENEDGTIEEFQPLHYNPFAYINSQEDVNQIADALIAFCDTEQCDTFFLQTLRHLFVSVIDFVAATDGENKGFYYAKDILKHFLPSKDSTTFTDGFSSKIESFYKAHPERIGATPFFRLTRGCSTDILRSVLLTAFIILDTLFPNEPHGTSLRDATDELNLETFRAKKTVLFIELNPCKVPSDICVLFLMQLPHILMTRFKDGDEPVHIILDEFQSLCTYDAKPLAIALRYNIMFSILIQELSQLRRQKHEIVDCCQTMLFLGGRDSETLQLFSDLTGAKSVKIYSKNGCFFKKRPCFAPKELALAVLSNDEMLICKAGKESFVCKTYNPEQHPVCKQLNH